MLEEQQQLNETLQIQINQTSSRFVDIIHMEMGFSRNICLVNVYE